MFDGGLKVSSPFIVEKNDLQKKCSQEKREKKTPYAILIGPLSFLWVTPWTPPFLLAGHFCDWLELSRSNSWLAPWFFSLAETLANQKSPIFDFTFRQNKSWQSCSTLQSPSNGVGFKKKGSTPGEKSCPEGEKWGSTFFDGFSTHSHQD